MALVIVLWVIVLLSVIAASHSSNAHTSTRLAARQLELAQLHATAESGVQFAILELLAQGNPEPWPVNGDVQNFTFMDENVSIAIRSATGLLDLNSANQQLLSALLDVTGADADTRDALVDAILDWRDKDDLTRLNGAEGAAYQSQSRWWTIRNGAFLSVDELRYVIGMTNQYFQQISPLLTVYSGRSGVNLEYAPAALIEALTGERVETADNFVPGSPQSGLPRQPGARRAGNYHIYVEASGTKAVAAVEAVVRIAPTDDQPYTILSWREPGRTLSGATQ